MSLIIAIKVPDCIVMASDSCMTLTTTSEKDGIKQVTAMSYTKHTAKMIIFRERLAVLYCGNMNINSDLTVLQFLQDIRSAVSKNITPEQLAKKILCESKSLSNNNRTVFLISGYIKNESYIYRVYTDNNEIELCLESQFGASYNGETEFVHPMMKSVADYNNMSPKDAIQLAFTMEYCMSNLAQFWKSQSVGGDIDIYIMYRDKTVQSGWVKADHIIPIIAYKHK